MSAIKLRGTSNNIKGSRMASFLGKVSRCRKPLMSDMVPLYVLGSGDDDVEGYFTQAVGPNSVVIIVPQPATALAMHNPSNTCHPDILISEGKASFRALEFMTETVHLSKMTSF